jgi:hypothetical protein
MARSDAPSKRWTLEDSMRSLLLLALTLFATPALADPGFTAVQKMLDDDGGWAVHKLDAKEGVDIYKKTLNGVEIPAFKGEKLVSVDPSVLFDRIIDFPSQVGLSDDIPLSHSVVLKTSGNTIDFWQYLKVPGWTLANDRYWFAKATISRDIGGVKGHHKQTWQHIDPSAYPADLAKAKAVDEDAVMTPLNYGSWEVIPQGNGTTKLIYRVVSDPGGRLPKAAQAIATGKTLPDNLLQFEAAAKAHR